VSIDALISQMRELEEELARAGDARQAFHATYLRTTEAVAQALRDGAFADAGWVERWDVAFAQLYLDALAASRRGEPVPGPWAVAFATAAGQPGSPSLRLILLGMNAHINYDLPQALLAVISDEEFGDPDLLARREADHRRIDEVLSARVGAEDEELKRLETSRSLTDRVLEPLNRVATRRFLAEARAKVWANAILLSQARRRGPAEYARRLAELELLSRARVADLQRPGPVLLRLASGGFGIRLSENGQAQRPAGQAAANGGPAGGGRARTAAAVAGAVRRAGAAGRAGAAARVGAARRGGGSAAQAHRRGPRAFSPVRVGGLECDVWVSYYRREWVRFLVRSVLLVRHAFGMDWFRTVHGAWLVLRANQLWAPATNDPAAARRCMRRFYALLRLSFGEPADPRAAARLEVEWWRVHREHQRGTDGDPGPLIDALAALYAYLYRVDEAAVRRAARERAEAMDISDRWVEEGCGLDSPLLVAERAGLVRSYAALLTAVHR
jgi:uncharacterized protein DUF5995